MAKKHANEVITVGNVKAGPGETGRGYNEIGELQDSQPLRLPVMIINGLKPGPTVYLQAVSDGDELNGVAVLHRVLKKLKPNKLKGAVIAVPLVNPHAFYTHQSASPIDGRKMNRCFPGRKNGTSSERIAHFLFENAVRESDMVIDLHQGGTHPMIDECRVRVNLGDRAGKASFELGRVFGIGYIFHKRGPDGQLARSGPAAGIPTIDPELGGTRGWDETSIRKGVKGVMNVLRHYGLVEGKAQIPKKQVVCRDHKTLFSSRGGFVSYKKKLYAKLKKGDVVAEIVDAFGEVLEKVKSPAAGIFWAHPPYPMAASGQRVATIGVKVKVI